MNGKKMKKYVVYEEHVSQYLDEPIVFEESFSSKKEAFKAFTKTCRRAKEISDLPPVAGANIPDHQPIFVKIVKEAEGVYENIAEAEYNYGSKTWFWTAR